MYRGAGFTLIQLIITVAIAAITLSLAIPSFTRTIASNRLSGTANSISAGLTQARLEAIRRNATTQFCSNVAANNGSGTLATACGTSGGAVYVLEPGGTATQVYGSVFYPADLALGNGSGGTSAIAALRYAGAGQATVVGGTGPYTGLVADVYTTRISTGNRRCIYMTTGNIVSSCTVTSASTCPANEPTPCQ